VQSGYFYFNAILIETLENGTESPCETYTRLRDVLIARHDTVSALKMHKKEYETYYRKLKEKDLYCLLPTKSFILAFEKYVSRYETSVFKCYSIMGNCLGFLCFPPCVY